MNIKENIKAFPNKPGVYLFKDKDGKVIYVGKAKSLKNRINSYFNKSKKDSIKTEFLLKRARDIDFIITDNEKEALLLENTLIKKYLPRYNIQLRDDKTYVSIRISAEHKFPGISVTRKPRKDKAKYFGPYSSSLSARNTLNHIIKVFKIRSCNDREFSNRIRPCLEYDLHRCTAPCVKKISEKEYLKSVNETIFFLKGNNKDIIRMLTEKMEKASQELKYEEAAYLRDAILQIKQVLEKQKVIVYKGKDKDIIGFVSQNGIIVFCILIIRDGVLIDQKIHTGKDVIEDHVQILENFLLEYYNTNNEIPATIYINHDLISKKNIETILFERLGKKTKISFPKKGDSRRLVELAMQNAYQRIKKDKNNDTHETLLRLEKKLNLANLPEVIECIDITNLMGKDAYGSVVVFIRGIPEKSKYRLYGIKTLDTPDDYSMIKEVILRRYSKMQTIKDLKKQSHIYLLPDLILIDGGKGQLNIVRSVLNELGFDDIPVVSIAKPNKDNKEKTDKIFIIGRKNPVKFSKSSKEFLLLQKIRDEAHRFGIKAHRNKRIRLIF